MGLHFKASARIDAFPARLVTMLSALAAVSEDMGRHFTVTSVSDGVHSAGSWHYVEKGTAVDVRTRDLTAAQRAELIARLRARLGPKYTVLDEGDHLHLQPRKGEPR